MLISLFGWLCLFPTGSVQADEFAPEDLEFFERQVRPLLVEHCQQCHGSKQQKGGLRLDSRAAALRGGETGPAMLPGEVDNSLLIEAINYDPDGYQMPPTGKLTAEQIAILTDWVRRKAPWPDSQPEVTADGTQFDLAERAKHWSFQPLQSPPVPEAIPTANANHPIDRFLVARLANAGLNSAPLTEKSSQLRRLSLELTGLPPTPEELRTFLEDHSPDAYERTVDRLLASPRYGERWARHWLDLVRFAETYGHEFDYEIRYPTPYRDYLIRAWNADVPYDQLVREHLAGDLLSEPRRDSANGRLESVIGTAFWWFSQAKHSPVDIRGEECDTVDNQIDVFSKTFLGLTVACARCHDHKFDAISQHDYYALAGYLQSSRQTHADVTPPEQTGNIVRALARPDLSFDPLTDSLPRWRAALDRMATWLVSTSDATTNAKDAWQKRTREEAAHSPRHPLHAWSRWPSEAGQVAAWKHDLKNAATQTLPITGGAFPAPKYSIEDKLGWLDEGAAFYREPRERFVWLLGDTPEQLLRGMATSATWIHSGIVSPKLQGTFRSPTFTIDQPYLDFLALRRGGSPNPLRGDYKSGQVHVVVDGFQIIRDPLYGMLTTHITQSETLRWFRADLTRFRGQRAYLEIEDADDGEIVIERILLHDQGVPALPSNEVLLDPLTADSVKTPDDAAIAFVQTVRTVLGQLEQESQNKSPAFSEEQLPAVADIVNWISREAALLPDLPAPSDQAIAFASERGKLVAALPRRDFTLAMTAGTLENEYLLIRGNHKKPGEEVPRRFLTAFNGSLVETADRLSLANDMLRQPNPLVPRVMVNRVWHHLFGRGIVPTTDDFGKMGQPPSHPELLDWLAGEFVRHDWSIKQLQRMLVTSHAFRQSSRAADLVAEERDPQNVLLHRANIQRLEGEAIRDSLLLISGRLDDRLYGPSILPHLSEFMEGRGRPGASGALDGEGRRSLYINVRRNFLTPLFLAFDFPTPSSTMGRRSSSNVPAQALTLMNNPFVIQQADRWVRSTDGITEPSDRIQQLYLTIFTRPATDDEVQAAAEFVMSQAVEYGSLGDPRAWTDLAHVLLNVKEFVFVE